MKAVPQRLPGHLATASRCGPYTAVALGNAGAEVLGASFLMGCLAAAAQRANLPYCEAGDGTVAPPSQSTISPPPLWPRPKWWRASAAASRSGIEVRQGERLLTKGRHGRAIVGLAKPPAPAAAAE